MLHCPNCDIECVKGANYCHNCGVYLLKDAEKVESEANNKEEFNQALRRLMPTPYIDKLMSNNGRFEGERRVVTILFSDVKGSTSMAENLDPEEVLDIMNGAFEILIEPITRYEGTIARLMGDAILAFFGAPIAHEDDPGRACLAALDIIEGAKKYSKKLEEEKGIDGFNVRVGINTGMVVVAEVGADLRVEYTAMGDAVNIAARMESAAEPGTVMITEDTKKLIEQNFETETLGPISVKGKSEPLKVFKLIKQKTETDKKNEQSNIISPLIGRKNEFELLSKLINELIQGKGQILSVIGEQGIGKTRLIEEVKKYTPAVINWSEGRALAYKQNESYWIAREIVRNLININIRANSYEEKEKLKNIVNSLPDIDFKDVYPFIAHLFNFELEMEFQETIAKTDAKTLRGQLYYALKELIKFECSKRPVVLVWEDLQWIDSSSVEFLKELLSLSETMPLFVMLIFRKNNCEVWNMHQHNIKRYREHYNIIELSELDEHDSLELLNNFSKEFSLPIEIQKKYLKKTGGNPLFIEEVFRSLIEKNVISMDSNSHYWSQIEKVISTPNLLQNVIMSRIDCLENGEKLILQTASVIGKSFQGEIISRVISKSMNAVQILKSIKILHDKGFIYEQDNNSGHNTTFEQQEFLFKQNLIQEVVYNSLLKSQRKKIHKALGDILEELNPGKPEIICGTLGYHFENCEIYDKAISYYSTAGNYSKNMFANEEAIFFYEKIIFLDDIYKIENSQLIKIFEYLGDLYFLTSNYQKALDYYTRIMQSEIENEISGEIYRKISQVYERKGKYDIALETCKKGLKILINQESIAAAHLHSSLGMIYYRNERLNEAKQENFRALEILINDGLENDLAEVYNNLALVFCKSNHLEMSLKYHNLCLEIREKTGNVTELAASYNNLGYLFQLKGLTDKAISYYEKSLILCEKSGNIHGLARTYDNLSHIYLAQKKDDIAMTYNLKAITLLGKIAINDSEFNHEIWLQSGVW